MDYYIINGMVYHDHTFQDRTLHIQNGKIELCAQAPAGAETVDAAGKKIVPGFIDIHTHGAVGVAVALQNPLEGAVTLCLETAHPGKFPAAIAQALGDGSLATHPALEKLKSLPLRKSLLPPTKEAVEAFMAERIP